MNFAIRLPSTTVLNSFMCVVKFHLQSCLVIAPIPVTRGVNDINEYIFMIFHMQKQVCSMCDLSQVDAEKPYFEATATASMVEILGLKLTHSWLWKQLQPPHICKIHTSAKDLADTSNNYFL